MEITLAKIIGCYDIECEIGKFLSCANCKSVAFSRCAPDFRGRSDAVLCCKCWSKDYWILSYVEGKYAGMGGTEMFLGTGLETRFAQIREQRDLPPRDRWRPIDRPMDRWNQPRQRSKTEKQNIELKKRIHEFMTDHFKWWRLGIDAQNNMFVIAFVNPEPKYRISVVNGALHRQLERIKEEITAD